MYCDLQAFTYRDRSTITWMDANTRDTQVSVNIGYSSTA